MTDDRYPMCQGPDPEPARAKFDLPAGGIDRAVLTQPSVYGTDNSCMLDAVDTMGGNFRAVAAVAEDVTDKELEALHARNVRRQRRPDRLGHRLAASGGKRDHAE